MDAEDHDDAAEEQKPPKKAALITWSAVVGVFALVVTVLGIPQFLVHAAPAVVKWTGESVLREVLAVVAIGLFSFGMFWFRKKQPLPYGLLECALAFEVVWYVLRSPPIGDNATFASLISAVYVFVRGYDNIDNGWRRQRERARRHEARLSLLGLTGPGSSLPTPRSSR